jgi:SHS2 domain-containing protein
VTARGREILPHTADTGLRAWAPDLAGLFEEAAAALAEIADEVPAEVRADMASGVPGGGIASGVPGGGIATGVPGGGTVMGADEGRILLEAPDLVGLAFAWLNELVGLVDVRHAALAGTSVQRVDVVAGRCEIEGRAWFIDRTAKGVRLRHDVKSATYHGLVVEREGETWSLTAYLDI